MMLDGGTPSKVSARLAMNSFIVDDDNDALDGFMFWQILCKMIFSFLLTKESTQSLLGVLFANREKVKQRLSRYPLTRYRTSVLSSGNPPRCTSCNPLGHKFFNVFV